MTTETPRFRAVRDSIAGKSADLMALIAQTDQDGRRPPAPAAGVLEPAEDRPFAGTADGGAMDNQPSLPNSFGAAAALAEAEGDFAKARKLKTAWTATNIQRRNDGLDPVA